MHVFPQALLDISPELTASVETEIKLMRNRMKAIKLVLALPADEVFVGIQIPSAYRHLHRKFQLPSAGMITVSSRFSGQSAKHRGYRAAVRVSAHVFACSFLVRVLCAC